MVLRNRSTNVESTNDFNTWLTNCTPYILTPVGYEKNIFSSVKFGIDILKKGQSGLRQDFALIGT